MARRGNPRRANGSVRRRNSARLRAEGRDCWICREFGRDPRIDYSLPPRHPMSFEVDELVPVSRYWLGGYATPEQCANDYSNLGAAHRACNIWRSNRTVAEVRAAAAGARASAVAGLCDPFPQPWGTDRAAMVGAPPTPRPGHPVSGIGPPHQEDEPQ